MTIMTGIKFHWLLLFQLVTISLFAQKNNTVSLSYFNSYLAGNQVELKTTLYPLSSQIGVNISIALDPNNIEVDYSLKGGLIYDFYRQDKLSISLGVRFSVESFFNLDFNAEQFSYNYDFPIDFKYDILPRFNVSLAAIPTWNRYFAYDNNLALSYSLGLGYYF